MVLTQTVVYIKSKAIYLFKYFQARYGCNVIGIYRTQTDHSVIGYIKSIQFFS